MTRTVTMARASMVFGRKPARTKSASEARSGRIVLEGLFSAFAIGDALRVKCRKRQVRLIHGWDLGHRAASGAPSTHPAGIMPNVLSPGGQGLMQRLRGAAAGLADQDDG